MRPRFLRENLDSPYDLDSPYTGFIINKRLCYNEWWIMLLYPSSLNFHINMNMLNYLIVQQFLSALTNYDLCTKHISTSCKCSRLVNYISTRYISIIRSIHNGHSLHIYTALDPQQHIFCDIACQQRHTTSHTIQSTGWKIKKTIGTQEN